MSQDLIKAYELAVLAEGAAASKVKQAKKDLEFHTRKVPRMEEAHAAAQAATLAARNAMTAAQTPATPSKKA